MTAFSQGLPSWVSVAYCHLAAGLNETAVFYCEAHNKKGVSTSTEARINIKGQYKYGMSVIIYLAKVLSV